MSRYVVHAPSRVKLFQIAAREDLCPPMDLAILDSLFAANDVFAELPFN